MEHETRSGTKKRRGRKTNAQQITTMFAQREHEHIDASSDTHSRNSNETLTSTYLPRGSFANEGDHKNQQSISACLSSILGRDRAGITQLARTLDVTEHTISRWMNGTSTPQPMHLKRLPNALPEHRNELIRVIKQRFPGLLESDITGHRAIPKDIYQRIIHIVATNDEEDLRLWQAIQALFEVMLLHLDPSLDGMAITYAKLSQKREDSMIHSLREVEMRGHGAWPPQTASARVFLGSTSLAGRAARFQRLQTWDGSHEGPIPVQIDQFERSACAAPLLRGRSIGGVLIASSIFPQFFNDHKKCEIIDECAKLLSIAVPPGDFQSIYHLDLRLMPDLNTQRIRLSEVYNNLTLHYVTLHNVQHSQAERWAEQDMEKEFELLANRE